MSKTVNAYTIMAKLEIECDVTVHAENLENALEKGRELKARDFYEPKGDVMDDSLHIKGLFEE